MWVPSGATVKDISTRFVVGMKQVERELERMPKGDQKEKLIERIEQIKLGARDLYF